MQVHQIEGRDSLKSNVSASCCRHDKETPQHSGLSTRTRRPPRASKGVMLAFVAACAVRISAAALPFELGLSLPRIHLLPQKSAFQADSQSQFSSGNGRVLMASGAAGPFAGHDVPIGVRSVLSGLAGGLAGSSVSLLLHPIDTLKTVTQDKGRSYKSFWDAGVKVCQEKGVLTGLYSGARTAAFGSFISSGVYFGTYQTMKERWATWLPDGWQSFAPSLAAVSGNAASSLIFVPKEVLKQRCQVGQLEPGQRAISLMRRIVQTEGIGAMYQGYLATLMRNAPGAMLKFGIYEQLKTVWMGFVERPLNPTELFTTGMAAGCMSSFLTTPLDVVKTRIMLGQVSTRFPPAALLQITREEGVKVLWSGLVPRLLWSATFFAVGISAYEVALESIFKGAAVRGAIPGVAKEKLQQDTHGGPGLPDIPKLVQKYYDVTSHVLLTR